MGWLSQQNAYGTVKTLCRNKTHETWPGTMCCRCPYYAAYDLAPFARAEYFADQGSDELNE